MFRFLPKPLQTPSQPYASRQQQEAGEAAERTDKQTNYNLNIYSPRVLNLDLLTENDPITPLNLNRNASEMGQLQSEC